MKLVFKKLMSGEDVSYPELSSFLAASSNEEILESLKALKDTYFVRVVENINNPYYRRFEIVNSPYYLPPVIMAAISGKLLHFRFLKRQSSKGWKDKFFLFTDETNKDFEFELVEKSEEELDLALKFSIAQNDLAMFQELSIEPKVVSWLSSRKHLIDMLARAGMSGSSLVFDELWNKKNLEILSLKQKYKYKIVENIIVNYTESTNFIEKLKIITTLFKHPDFKDCLTVDLELGVNMALSCQKYNLDTKELFLVLSHPAQFLRLELYNKYYDWVSKEGILYPLLQTFIEHTLSILKLTEDDFYLKNSNIPNATFDVSQDEGKLFTYIALYLVDDEEPNWQVIEKLLKIPTVKQYFDELVTINKLNKWDPCMHKIYRWDDGVRLITIRQRLISEHINNNLVTNSMICSNSCS